MSKNGFKVKYKNQAFKMFHFIESAFRVFSLLHNAHVNIQLLIITVSKLCQNFQYKDKNSVYSTVPINTNDIMSYIELNFIKPT